MRDHVLDLTLSELIPELNLIWNHYCSVEMEPALLVSSNMNIDKSIASCLL